MDGSHFQNNFIRTKTCPVALANVNELCTQRPYWRYHWSVTYVTQQWKGITRNSHLLLRN